MTTPDRPRWIILNCTFANSNASPALSQDFVERFFMREGQLGLRDYWVDVSGGRFDPSAWEAHGPIALGRTMDELENEAQAAAGSDHPRASRIRGVIDEVGDRVDFDGADGVIVIVNQNFDTGAARVVLPDGRRVWASIYSPRLLTQRLLGHLFAHETAHMLNLDHSARLGAREEWARQGRTDQDWEYTDGWCISGGIRDDGSASRDCRFDVPNPAILNARSGPAIKAGYLRDLGWLSEERVYTYDSHRSQTRRLAALYAEDVEGDRLLETRSTQPEGHTHRVELRWKEGWDRGIPRHAFLLRRVEPGGHTLLIPASPTQHDWGPGDRYISVEEALGIAFERIDPATRSGTVRLTRVIGQSAETLVAGGWGMVALQRGTGRPFHYLGSPRHWAAIGQPATQFAVAGDALYAISNDRKGVWRYTDADEGWEKVGNGGDALIAGGWGLVALERGSGVPYAYKHGRGWTKVGGPGAQFAITNEGLYGLSRDRSQIWRYDDEGERWTQVGTSADALVAGGAGLLALQRGTGVPFLYLGRPHRWREVGGPAAQFCFSDHALYGLSTNRQAIWKYSGESNLWHRVGDAADSIYADGETLYALDPGRTSITQY
jgi:hypothetical protein